MTEQNKTQPQSIYSKIIEMQQTIKAVEKERTKGLQYETVNHWDITTLVKDIALEKGLVILPYIKTTSHEGNDTWVTVAIQITDTETGEQIVIGDYPGQGRDTQDKGPGKAVSYAIKTAFLKIFMMSLKDDTESEKDQNITINIVKKAMSDYDINSLEECKSFVQHHKEDLRRLQDEYNEAVTKSNRTKNPIPVPDILKELWGKVLEVNKKAKEIPSEKS